MTFELKDIDDAEEIGECRTKHSHLVLMSKGVSMTIDDCEEAAELPNPGFTMEVAMTEDEVAMHSYSVEMPARLTLSLKK